MRILRLEKMPNQILGQPRGTDGNMRRRNWTVDDKLAIVLEGIRGTRPVTEICREHEISPNQYYKWREQFFEGAQEGLQSKRERSEVEAEIEKLQKIIGKQAVQIEILRKTKDLFRTR